MDNTKILKKSELVFRWLFFSISPLKLFPIKQKQNQATRNSSRSQSTIFWPGCICTDALLKRKTLLLKPVFLLFAFHKNIFQSGLYRVLLVFRPSICHSWAIAVQRQVPGAAVRWMGEMLRGCFQEKGSVPTPLSPSALYISSQDIIDIWHLLCQNRLLTSYTIQVI